jgi:hypothetical protein
MLFMICIGISRLISEQSPSKSGTKVLDFSGERRVVRCPLFVAVMDEEPLRLGGRFPASEEESDV